MGAAQFVHSDLDMALEGTATRIASGKPPAGWREDSRGIVSYHVDEGVFKDADVVCSLLYHGFEPGGGSIDMYRINCVIRPAQVRVQKKTRKRLASQDGELYTLRVDTAWEAVVRGVQEHTWTFVPGDCWLSNDLAAALKAASCSSEAMRKKVGFHTIELWYGEEIIAANIGYTLGDLYSGFTKFYKRTEDSKHSGAGVMLSSAIGAWLSRRGFTLYAMGENAPYKSKGVLVDSFLLVGEAWLSEIRRAREVQGPPVLHSPEHGSRVSVRQLLDEFGQPQVGAIDVDRHDVGV